MIANERLSRLGQTIWLDGITRDLVSSGTLERYIRELSITSNPSIFDHAIRDSGSYDEAIQAHRSPAQSG